MVSSGLACRYRENIILGLAPGDWVSRVAGVAQLAEHNVANVVVVGSNPITRSLVFAADGVSPTRGLGL